MIILRTQVIAASDFVDDSFQRELAATRVQTSWRRRRSPLSAAACNSAEEAEEENEDYEEEEEAAGDGDGDGEEEDEEVSAAAFVHSDFPRELAATRLQQTWRGRVRRAVGEYSRCIRASDCISPL